MLGAVEEDEAGRFDFTEFVGEAFFVSHAALGGEAEEDGLKTTRFNVWDELLEKRGFAGAATADDAGAPLLGFEALNEGFPIYSGWKMEREGFKFGSGERVVVVRHGARVSCGVAVWEEKVMTGGGKYFLLFGTDGFGFCFSVGSGGGDDGDWRRCFFLRWVFRSRLFEEGVRGIFGGHGVVKRRRFFRKVGDFAFGDDGGFWRSGCGFGFGGWRCFLRFGGCFGWRGIEVQFWRRGCDGHAGLFDGVGLVVPFLDEGELQCDDYLELGVFKFRGVAQGVKTLTGILPAREASLDFAGEECGVDVVAVARFHPGECGADFI